MRIGIVGCAGTGKSVLAESLANELKLPFLPSKVITGEILQRDGYDYGSGQQIEKFLATPEHQLEILKRTREQQDVYDFVTDRTAIDLAAYAIVEMDDPVKVKAYVEDCRSLAFSYDRLIFCPWQDREILPNNKRTLDPWYQFTIHSVQKEVARMFGVEMLELKEEELEDRVKALVGIFKPHPY